MYKIDTLEDTINSKDIEINKLVAKINKKDDINNHLRLDINLCQNNLDTARGIIVDVNTAVDTAFRSYNLHVKKLNKMLKQKPKIIYKRELYKDENCTMGIELNKGISEMTYEDF